MQAYRFLLVGVTVIALALSGCGGGGGGSSSGSTSSGSGGTTSGGATYNVDSLGVPQFVNVSHVDITLQSNGQPVFTTVSLFRSSEGHDYSDSVESCRSLKHYFSAPTSTTNIVSPVSGSIASITAESVGSGSYQVAIVSDAQPAFTFILFHVATSSGMAVGTKVTAGQVVGTASGGADIAVQVQTSSSTIRLISFFQTLTDTGFQPYAKLGIASRDAFSLTKAQRDANPLTCVSGQQFTNNSNTNDPLPTEIGLVAPTAQLINRNSTNSVPAGVTSLTVYANQPGAVASWTLAVTQTNVSGTVVQSNVQVASGGAIAGGINSVGTPVNVTVGGSAGDTFVYTLTITDTRGQQSTSSTTLKRV